MHIDHGQNARVLPGPGNAYGAAKRMCFDRLNDIESLNRRG